MAKPTATQTFSTERRIVVLIHSAIAGASIAAALELASRETLSSLLMMSLGCFAVAVPASVALVILFQVIYELGMGSRQAAAPENQSWPMLSYLLAVVDQITCYVGFLLIFWNFHWIVGMLFVVSTTVAYATVWMAEKRLRKTQKLTKEAKTT
jgi:hypothetical protein